VPCSYSLANVDDDAVEDLETLAYNLVNTALDI
jgi:hypothetical protein